MPEAAFLFIHALTGLHPGSGTAMGVVDLPVQRERHTGWPTIPGSSLKGVLRAEAQALAARDDVHSMFGPDTSNAADHAGALACTDARILAFPVRSLKGVFAWVTCPAVLQRLARDAGLTRLPFEPGRATGGSGTALVAADSPLRVEGSKLVLEEFDFDAATGGEAVARWIADHAVGDEATRARLPAHLVVVDDDAFGHFVRHATEVTARIALDYQTRTVRQGALFYEEFLPPETLFYSLLIAQDVRRRGDGRKAAEVIAWLDALDLRTIQVGGGETIGKGFCSVRIVREAGR